MVVEPWKVGEDEASHDLSAACEPISSSIDLTSVFHISISNLKDVYSQLAQVAE